MKNRGEYRPTLSELGRLRPPQHFFQVIRVVREEPTFGGSKVGAVFVILLKNLPIYILFVATIEVNIFFVDLQEELYIVSNSVANSVINK